MTSIENSLLPDQIDLLDQILTASPDPIYVVDRAGRYQYASPAGLSALELQAEDVFGKHWRELDLPDSFMQRHEQERELVFQTGTPVQGETTYSTVTGNKYYEYVLSPLHGQDGTIEAVINTSRDITDRKRAEARLQEQQNQIQRQLAEIETIYQSAPIGLNVLDTELRFVRINQRLAEMNGLPIEAHIGRTVREVLPDLADTADQVLRPILESGEPLLNVEITGETPAQPGVQRTWLESFLPLKDGDCIIGISTVCEEITDRKRAEQTLAKELLRIQILFNTSFDGIVILDGQGRVVNANPRFAEMIGYTLEETSRLHVSDWDAQFTDEELQQVMQDCLSRKQGVFETQHRCKNGSIYDVEISYNVVEWEGEILRFCACRNISERKRIEAERCQFQLVLQEKEALYRQLFESNPQPMWVYDLETLQFLAVNPAAIAKYGYSESEFLSMTIADIRPPEDVPRLLEKISTVEEGLDLAGIWQHRMKDGRLILVDIVSHVLEFAGRRADLVVAHDITDRKRAEEALQEREAVLQLFAQNAPAGIAMFDREMRYVMASQRWAEDYNQGSLESIIGRSIYDLFPDLPERWRQVHQRCLAGAIETCEEDLFVWADGTQQWIRWETRPWYTATDKIGGIIIFAEDITYRKQSATAILQLNQELQQKVTELQTLLDVIPIGIGIAEDPECQRIRVNPAFAEALGIPPTVNASLSAPEEERPTTFKVYQNGRELAPEELPLQYAATYGVEIRDLEVDIVWQDGRTVTLLEYAAPLLDESGQPRGSVGAFLNITDRKRAEAALRESQERYRALAQNFPNGVVLLFDTDLRYVLVEGQGVTQAGMDRSALEGKTIWEAVDSQTCRLVEPLYRGALAGESGTMEIPFGDRIYFVHCLPVYNDQGFVTLGMLMSQDITLQKQAEQVLRTARDELERQVQARTQELQEANAMLAQREREFRTLVENTPDVITRHDRQHRCLYINPACIQSLGMPPEFFIGKKPSELGYPEDLTQFWQTSLQTVFSKGEMQIDEFTAMNGDELRSYQVYVVPEREVDRSIVSVMTIGRDVTLLRQAEESTRKLAEELQRSNRELEQFAYIASHDLQEPLRAVASFTQLLAKQYQGKLDAKAETYIEFIVDGATRMQHLIRDLLAYSRAGRHELKWQPVDCNELLERVKKDLRIAIAENRAVITVDPLPVITVDLNQMAILLQNLVGNSLKYRSEADPHIHISAKMITANLDRATESESPLPLTPPTSEWLFSIQDNGIGIEPQYAERIFGIFQRLHTIDEYSGTGLGLAICRKIIERHQGRIWVESQLGQGATFFFTIPLSIPTQDENTRQIT